MGYHIRITVKNEDEMVHSYVPLDGSLGEKEQALKAGHHAVHTTPEVIMVEIFQAGVTKPIKVLTPRTEAEASL